MADDLRAQIRTAILGVRLRPSPSAIQCAQRGEPVQLSSAEVDVFVGAVMAVLQRPQEPDQLALDFPGGEGE